MTDFISLSNTDLLSAAVGLFLPPVVAVIQQPRWGNLARSLVTVAVCLLVGGMMAYLKGAFNSTGILRCFLLVMVFAYTTYREFWKPTGAAGAIEQATSLKPAQVGEEGDTDSGNTDNPN